MSRDNIEDLLEQCLSAYETGLSPEECLSAFPAQRAELEPLFRQALSLRFAFAATPSEEFRNLAHERLMFAAGRDVIAALDVQPDPEYISQAREHLMFAAGREVIAALNEEPDPGFVMRMRMHLRAAAGASVQEALRDVPPPHLPFWTNARRRLLESAAAGPRPAVQPMALFMRVGMSAAVVVLAMTLATLAYITTASKPTSVAAQLAGIEQQLTAVEQETASGHIVPPGILADLSRRTNELAQKLNDEPSNAAVAEKLPNIIERQQNVVDQAVTSGPTTTELEQAKAALDQADQAVKLLAARADTPAVTTTTSQTQTTTSLTTTQSTNTTAATTTGTPGPTATAVQGEPLQIRIAPTDAAIGLIWVEIKTSQIRFLVPDSWQIKGVSTSPTGQATLTGNYLSFSIENATVLVDMRTGEINALIGNDSIILRTAGVGAKPLVYEQVVRFTGSLAPQFEHFLGSIELSLPATATPTVTSTTTTSTTTSPAASTSTSTSTTSTSTSPTVGPTR